MAKKISEDKKLSEVSETKRITNNTLQCKDCALRYDDSKIFSNTSKCEEFPDCKPDKVLCGEECAKYVKE